MIRIRRRRNGDCDSPSSCPRDVVLGAGVRGTLPGTRSARGSPLVLTADVVCADAAFSRSQVDHLVKVVVPLEVLSDAQLRLARAHMKWVGGLEYCHEDNVAPLSDLSVWRGDLMDRKSLGNSRGMFHASRPVVHQTQRWHGNTA